MLLMYVIVSYIWKEVLNSQVDVDEREREREASHDAFNRVVTFREIQVLINVPRRFLIEDPFRNNEWLGNGLIYLAARQ